jgi:hypothetical protein
MWHGIGSRQRRCQNSVLGSTSARGLWPRLASHHSNSRSQKKQQNGPVTTGEGAIYYVSQSGLRSEIDGCQLASTESERESSPSSSHTGLWVCDPGQEQIKASAQIGSRNCFERFHFPSLSAPSSKMQAIWEYGEYIRNSALHTRDRGRSNHLASRPGGLFERFFTSKWLVSPRFILLG